MIHGSNYEVHEIESQQQWNLFKRIIVILTLSFHPFISSILIQRHLILPFTIS